MRYIPVDINALGAVTFVAAEPRMDGEGHPVLRDGVPVHRVSLLIRPTGGRPEVLDVNLTRVEPVHMMDGQRVRLSGLTASPWERNGRSGVSYTADAIDPIGGDNK